MSYYVISRLRYGNTEQKRWDHVAKTGLSSCFVHIIMVKADISFDMKKIVNIIYILERKTAKAAQLFLSLSLPDHTLLRSL